MSNADAWPRANWSAVATAMWRSWAVPNVPATSTQDRLRGFLEELAHHPEITVQPFLADAYSLNSGRKEMLARLSEAPAQSLKICGE